MHLSACYLIQMTEAAAVTAAVLPPAAGVDLELRVLLAEGSGIDKASF